jgi:hypothetical protein
MSLLRILFQFFARAIGINCGMAMNGPGSFTGCIGQSEGDKTIPLIIDCVRAYATVGEICEGRSIS